MSMFATKAGENYDGLSIPSLEPGKYENVTLQEVNFGRTTKGDGTQGKQIITFLFKTEDGQSHQHTEYEVDPTDTKAESKLKNMLKRVGHIMSKFVPEDRLTQNSDTFEAYGNWVKATISSVPFKDVKVDILITGNVYQGKATAGFTGYPPFIALHGKQLQHDNNGLKANKEYFAKVSAGSAPDADNGNAPGSGTFNTQEGPKADF